MCKPEYFCTHPEVDWHIVKDHMYTLNNWMSKYDLYCASNLMVSAVGISFFIGFALGSAFLPNMSDKRGRKNAFLASTFL